MRCLGGKRIWLSMAIVAWAAEVVFGVLKPDSYVQEIPEASQLTVEGFWPLAECGVLNPGEAVKMALKVVGPAVDCGLEAEVDVHPAGGLVVRDVTRTRLQRGENIIELPARHEFGHYTVIARFLRNGEAFGYAQSAYIIAPPTPAKRDPYFMLDKSGFKTPHLDYMKRMGFGSVYLARPFVRNVLKLRDEEINSRISRYLPENRSPGNRRREIRSSELRDDFEYVGSSGLTLESGYEDILYERLQQGLPPLTDADCRRLKQMSADYASALRDRVKIWIVPEEVDAFIYSRSGTMADNYLHYLSAWTLMAQNVIAGLKDANPGCRIGVLGICCTDYFRPDKFGISRRILRSLAGKFDFVAIDAYSGNWNHTRSNLTPPEHSLVPLLKDSAALSTEFGGKNIVGNAERCVGIDFLAAFDDRQSRNMLDVTMRSLILARTVTNSLFYSLHYTASNSHELKVLQHPEKDWKNNPIPDMGLWRVVLPNRQDLYESKWVPRMALLGAGTVARNFAFVSKPRVQKLAESVYAVSFEAPGDIVMGVWTVNGGCKVKVELKAPTLFSDAWGNEKKLPTGSQTFDVSTTPFILRFPKSVRLMQEEAIADFAVVSRDENTVDVTIPVPQGEPAKAQVSFSAPEAVFPARAATPEAGIFARDCHVWPQVETAFGWTEDAFCARVTVKNKALIQRQRDAAAVRDDCVIFTFLDDNPAEGGHELMKVANEIVAYAGEQGGRAFLRNPDGGRFVCPCGTCKIVKKGQMETTYDVRIPWKDVMPDFKPARNARFAFNMRCPCVPHLGVNDSAPYSLMLSKPLAEDRLNMSQWVFLEFCRHVELK